MMGVGLGGASLCSPILVPSALFRGARVPPQPRCPHRWVGRGCRRVARQPVASAERGQSPTLLGAGTAVGWGSWNGCGRGVPRGSPALDKDVSVWCPAGQLAAGMAQPSAPPPYDDKNPLYPPSAYPQPSHYGGGYPQPGGYPAPAGYVAPGGYGTPGGYPQPGMAMPTMPVRFGDTYGGDGMGHSSPIQSADWDDRKVRHSFIRKVYAIISVQLLVTVGIIAMFTFVSPVRSFVQRNIAVYYSSYAVFLVTYLVLVCCQGPRRRFPWNLILLSIFTLAMSFMTGTIASMYQTKAVLIAMLITAIVAIIVTIFCFQTKVDFTSCTGLFCVLGIVVMVTGIVTVIVLSFKYVPWLHMLYAAIGAIAFTLFLAYDTQLVLGNRKNTLSPEEYIYGALTIYTDIVYIFTFLLQIVGRD
uniref:Transmembrane BAX inhibitor motif containing 1 n=3 Tax=Gallus gallus TaxID=9031 RepID=A0A8V0Z2X0_CHICK